MNISTTLAWLIAAHFIQGLIGELQYARTPPKKGLLHYNDVPNNGMKFER